MKWSSHLSMQNYQLTSKHNYYSLSNCADHIECTQKMTGSISNVMYDNVECGLWEDP